MVGELAPVALDGTVAHHLHQPDRVGRADDVLPEAGLVIDDRDDDRGVDIEVPAGALDGAGYLMNVGGLASSVDPGSAEHLQDACESQVSERHR